MRSLSIRYTERLVMRFGAKTTLLPGLVLVMAGLLWFTQAPVGGDYVTNVLPVMILLGAGVGSSFPALVTLAMSGATREDAGLASGLVNTTVQVGAALGLAVLATLAITKSGELRHAGESARAALNGWLPPRVPGRSRARPGGARRGRDGPAAGARAGGGGRSRAGPGRAPLLRGAVAGAVA